MLVKILEQPLIYKTSGVGFRERLDYIHFNIDSNHKVKHQTLIIDADCKQSKIFLNQHFLSEFHANEKIETTLVFICGEITEEVKDISSAFNHSPILLKPFNYETVMSALLSSNAKVCKRAIKTINIHKPRVLSGLDVCYF
ncbi:hypothetical protein F9L16_17780 [Agarivorans sp. B2Z047]|uniref:hypothetical protein n=1 Tax=Agarivorans sp. B2Z047 TaxID=2652721 RepID=UPI00128B0A12|nr:hypothetical protein [Agarivorans sp. B2Z047]MPW30839.1 hypothetical protein [Agarivorans sp. B2Z047]UQN40930.1 hypothetical protein LQZ07_14225 [Agarivorans sp. B2Z047]